MLIVVTPWLLKVQCLGAVLAGVDVLRRRCCRTAPDQTIGASEEADVGHGRNCFFGFEHNTHSGDAVFTMLLGTHFIDLGHHKLMWQTG